MNMREYHIQYKSLFRVAAWASILLMAYTLATLAIVAFVGGPPTTIAECFSMLNENEFTGLLRLDLLTVFAMPLYYVLFLGLFFSLHDTMPSESVISLAFVFVGVTLFLAAPSVFSFARLSNGYFSAADDTERNAMVAAGEALLSTDIWNGTGPRVGGLLVQAGAVIFSVIMLNSIYFSKFTAVIGIVTHGLDLLHVVFGFFDSSIADALLIGAGPLYLVWFPLVANGLHRLARLE